MFKVTARTILELGSELISSDIIAFYELIKNGFDAGTESGVEIQFEVVLRRNTYLALRRQAEAKDADFLSIQSLALAALNTDAPETLHSTATTTLQTAKTLPELVNTLEKIYKSNTV